MSGRTILTELTLYAGLHLFTIIHCWSLCCMRHTVGDTHTTGMIRTLITTIPTYLSIYHGGSLREYCTCRPIQYQDRYLGVSQMHVAWHLLPRFSITSGVRTLIHHCLRHTIVWNPRPENVVLCTTQSDLSFDARNQVMITDHRLQN